MRYYEHIVRKLSPGIRSNLRKSRSRNSLLEDRLQECGQRRQKIGIPLDRDCLLGGKPIRKKYKRKSEMTFETVATKPKKLRESPTSLRSEERRVGKEGRSR